MLPYNVNTVYLAHMLLRRRVHRFSRHGDRSVYGGLLIRSRSSTVGTAGPGTGTPTNTPFSDTFLKPMPLLTNSIDSSVGELK